jgi:phage tail sheath gpL-like
MAASGFSFHFALPKGVADIPRVATVDKKEVLQALDGIIWQILAGSMPAGAVNAAGVTLFAQSGGTSPAVAYGTLTLSSASGSVGGTINGTTVTVTASGGDTATSTSLAAAINANTTVNPYVFASASGAVVTVSANAAGNLGNLLTLVASGTGVTAGHLSSGKLSGGAGGDVAPQILQYS